ncbi:MAG: formyltransferase family protein [Roseitalea porphyridii]|uniref:formyltransferase family protein n=1 Tax=Roseitalea porphyridii TaxID=1852022 RepID=UPI0032EC8FA6
MAILTNDDLTGSIVFSPLLSGSDSFEVVSVALSKSPVKGRGGAVSSVLSLAQKMSFRYWLFLLVTNGLFQFFAWRWSRTSLLPDPASFVPIRSGARKSGIPVLIVEDFNEPDLRKHLADQKVDLLLIRISAILKSGMLSVPRFGTWCVHSSLLPAYGGIAGEFHALRQGQLRIGSTVFSVTEKLDAGPPLAQVSLPVDEQRSLFHHIVSNNQRASDLLREMVEQQAGGKPPGGSLLNAGLDASYFTWPSASDVKEFRDRRGRLVELSEIADLIHAVVQPSSGLLRSRGAIRGGTSKASVE